MALHVQTHHLYLFWGALPLVVSVLVDRIGGGSGPWGARFKAAATPTMFLLLLLLPETTLSATTAALGSIGVCAVVVAAFVALHPPARRVAVALAALIAPIVVAALGVIWLTVRAELGNFAFAALMTLTLLGVTSAGGWTVKRIHRARRGVDG